MTHPQEPHWLPLPQQEKAVQATRQAFIDTYGQEPDGIWSAPGRLNLLGEYIDFLGGTCLPMPLPYRTILAGRLRTDGILRARSLQMPGQDAHIAIADIKPGTPSGWLSYVAGVAWALNQEGSPDLALPQGFGADLLINSQVPVGGGLSSSAALEASTVLALLDLAQQMPARGQASQDPRPSAPGQDKLRSRLVQVCIQAENEIAGARTGGLDQTAALRSQAGTALAVDFRDFSLTPLRLDLASQGLAWLVIDTKTPHELAGGEFAARRAANEAVAASLGLDHLRNLLPQDLAWPQLGSQQAKARRLQLLDTSLTKALDAYRAQQGEPDFPVGWIRHPLHDMLLTERAAALMTAQPDLGRAGWEEVGQLLTESFFSMRDDLQVSRPQIDLAVQACLAAGALGARLVGGGFGGAVMALVEQDQLEASARQVAEAYRQAGYQQPDFLPMLAGAPARQEA